MNREKTSNMITERVDILQKAQQFFNKHPLTENRQQLLISFLAGCTDVLSPEEIKYCVRIGSPKSLD